MGFAKAIGVKILGSDKVGGEETILVFKRMRMWILSTSNPL